MNAEASHHYTKLLSKNEKSSHDLNKMGIDDLDKELKSKNQQDDHVPETVPKKYSIEEESLINNLQENPLILEEIANDERLLQKFDKVPLHNVQYTLNEAEKRGKIISLQETIEMSLTHENNVIMEEYEKTSQLNNTVIEEYEGAELDVNYGKNVQIQQVNENENQFHGNDMNTINNDKIEEGNNYQIITNIKQKPKIIGNETLKSKVLIKKEKHVPNESSYQREKKSKEGNNKNFTNLVSNNQASKRSSLKFKNNENSPPVDNFAKKTRRNIDETEECFREAMQTFQTFTSVAKDYYEEKHYIMS